MKKGCMFILIGILISCLLTGLAWKFLFKHMPENVLEISERMEENKDIPEDSICYECEEEENKFGTEELSIPFELGEEDHLMRITVGVNGIPMKFIVDTGSTGIQISSVEYYYLLRQGLIKETDEKGKIITFNADGEHSEKVHITLEKVTIGETTINDVKAVICENIKAPSLLGQDILKALGTLKIDYNKGLIIIEK